MLNTNLVLILSLFISFVSFAAADGEVQQLLDKYCELIPTLSGSQALDSKELAEAVSERNFRALYHDYLDCSWGASNPIMGSNLKNASYEACIEAMANGMSQGKQLELGASMCVETIADENKGTGAFWMSATIDKRNQSIMFAERIKIVDGKIAACHVDFDTYEFLSNHNEWDGSSMAIIGSLAVGIVIGMVVSIVLKKNQYIRLE